MNGLPALKFDGTDDFFSFNGNFLIGADYTIFVVEARGAPGVNPFLGVSQPSLNQMLGVGYNASNRIVQSHYSNPDLLKSISTYTSTISRTHSFVFSKESGRALYTNGGTGTINTTLTSPLISYPGSSIGNYRAGMNLYQGYLAEIIFYSRALSNKERQEVELYLSKKWGIKLG
jgi:hypothetical protein